MDDLRKELESAVTLTLNLAKRNYLLAYFFTFLSVMASIAAGILVALDSELVPPAVIAAVASLPAGMMTVNTVFRFEQKSAWFWKKNKGLAGLYRALIYEGADPVEISRGFSRLEAEMEGDWVSFGISNQKGG